jgi:hypothetical protein
MAPTSEMRERWVAEDVQWRRTTGLCVAGRCYRSVVARTKQTLG